MSSLRPGASLGRYRIGLPVGSGGMGQVFIAEDQKLGRRVAIKVLHNAFALDAHGRTRFLREARAAAALNHPNIITIHSVEEEDGLPFIVMELIEGSPLSTLIPTSGLSRAQVLEWAVPLADAVAAAHAQGVIHRDLKPQNVMIAMDSRLKVLDFGLARLDTSEGGVTASTLAGTGKVMGTPAYMSPEQAQGLMVDHRADIFSLGVMMFEMATGRRPFTGSSDASVLASLLRDKAPLLTDVNPAMPRRLAQAVGRCLHKDPLRRYQSVVDLRADLEEIREDSGDDRRAARSPITTITPPEVPVARRAHGTPEPPRLEEPAEQPTPVRSSPPTAPPAFPPSRPPEQVIPRSRRGLVLAGLVAGTGLGVVGSSIAFRERHVVVVPPAQGPSIILHSRLTTDEKTKDAVALSADGKFIVFSSSSTGNSDIYRQRVGGSNPMNLTAASPLDDAEPALSPDGERIAFRSERDGGGIFLMGSTGESVVRLTDFGHSPAWSPDGGELLVTSTGSNDAYGWTSAGTEVYRVKVPGGARRRILTAGTGDGPHDLSGPVWSPHGLRIACWGLLRPGAERDIGTLSPDGTDLVLLTRDVATDFRPIWSPDGRYLYFSSDRGGALNLWRIPVDEQTGHATGEPEPVTNGVGASITMASFSEDGRLMAYIASTEHAEVVRVPFDPEAGRITGPPARITNGTDFDIRGELLAVQTRTPREDIVLMNLDGRERRLLTDDAVKDRRPRFSPDGKLIRLRLAARPRHLAALDHPSRRQRPHPHHQCPGQRLSLHLGARRRHHGGAPGARAPRAALRSAAPMGHTDARGAAAAAAVRSATVRAGAVGLLTRRQAAGRPARRLHRRLLGHHHLLDRGAPVPGAHRQGIQLPGLAARRQAHPLHRPPRQGPRARPRHRRVAGSRHAGRLLLPAVQAGGG